MLQHYIIHLQLKFFVFLDLFAKTSKILKFHIFYSKNKKRILEYFYKKENYELKKKN